MWGDGGEPGAHAAAWPRRPFRNSGASHMNHAFPKHFFDGLGHLSLPDQFRKLQYATRTAVLWNRMAWWYGKTGRASSDPIFLILILISDRYCHSHKIIGCSRKKILEKSTHICKKIDNNSY
jgi:hypothetical protein